MNIKERIKQLKEEKKNLFFNGLFAFSTLLITIMFFDKTFLAILSLGSIALAGLIKWKSRLTLLMFVFGALFGAIAEVIAIYFGVWSYSVSNFFNIPLWLLIVWGNVAAFIYQTAFEFKKLGIKK